MLSSRYMYVHPGCQHLHKRLRNLEIKERFFGFISLWEEQKVAATCFVLDWDKGLKGTAARQTAGIQNNSNAAGAALRNKGPRELQRILYGPGTLISGVFQNLRSKKIIRSGA